MARAFTVKFSNYPRLRLVQFWELEKHHSCPYITKCTRLHTIFYWYDYSWLFEIKIRKFVSALSFTAEYRKLISSSTTLNWWSIFTDRFQILINSPTVLSNVLSLSKVLDTDSVFSLLIELLLLILNTNS